MIWLACAAAFALTPNDRVRVELRGGGDVEGSVHTATVDQLSLMSEGQLVDIPLVLVETAWIGERVLTPEELAAELQAYVEHDLARRDLGPHMRRPPPVVVGTASVLWPGSGHLMLGDVPSFAGYALVDAGLIGAGLWFALGEGTPGPLIPLAALDAGVRLHAAADASRTARRRRGAVVVGPTDDGGWTVGFARSW